MSKTKIGNVIVEELAPGLLKLIPPTWFRSRNLEKALTGLSRTHKIKIILRLPRSPWVDYYLVFLED